VAKLQQAAKDGILIEIERSSHSLKSSSGNVGAMELTRLCSEVHSLARAVDLNLARKTLPKLEVEFTRVLKAVVAEIGPGNTSHDLAGVQASA
jgi:HPt (histidine-containing phosphotransfer) domain-containing protein